MLASMFLAIAPIHIELSRQVVMYTLMLVGVLLAVHFLYQAHERSVRSWGLAGFFVACTLYAHPFGAFPFSHGDGRTRRGRDHCRTRVPARIGVRGDLVRRDAGVRAVARVSHP